MNCLNNIHIIILAGGKGTRMKNPLPKCACEINGKSFVNCIIDTCSRIFGVEDIVTVVGYKREKIISLLPDYVKYAVQNHQLGTGDAVKSCRNLLEGKEGITIIIPGDMPLVDADLINDLIKHHTQSENELTFVSTIMFDPKSYGRIYRENGKVQKIVEYKNCNKIQKKIKEINSSLYCVDNKILFDYIDMIKPNELTGEYYLTDLVELIAISNKADAYIKEYDYHLVGINDRETLTKLVPLVSSENFN